MIEGTVTPGKVREVLRPFGDLRPQPAADWTGDTPLHPSLTRFYAEVGPYGFDGPYADDGLSIPASGNDIRLPALSRLWELQAGYRWHGLTGARLTDWPDAWLVVADQGGDPFILDGDTGRVLHARHGEGAWDARPLFADVFVMAMALGLIGTVHDEAGEDLLDDDCEVRPAWRAVLVERLTPLLGAPESEALAATFGW